MAPPNHNSFSVSVVLPASGWAMMANVRRRWISLSSDVTGITPQIAMQSLRLSHIRGLRRLRHPGDDRVELRAHIGLRHRVIPPDLIGHETGVGEPRFELLRFEWTYFFNHVDLLQDFV